MCVCGWVLSLITLHTLSDPCTPLSVAVCLRKSGFAFDGEVPSTADLDVVSIPEELCAELTAIFSSYLCSAQTGSLFFRVLFMCNREMLEMCGLYSFTRMKE